MFSFSRRNLVSSHQLFTKLLSDSNALSKKGKTTPSSTNNYIYRNLSEETRAKIDAIALSISEKTGSQKSSSSYTSPDARRRAEIKKRARLERLASRLTSPNYVTSKQHYINVNAQRFENCESGRERERLVNKLYHEEKDQFAKAQLTELAKKRAHAELCMKEAKYEVKQQVLEENRNQETRDNHQNSQKKTGRNLSKRKRQNKVNAKKTLDKLRPRVIKRYLKRLNRKGKGGKR